MRWYDYNPSSMRTQSAISGHFYHKFTALSFFFFFLNFGCNFMLFHFLSLNTTLWELSYPKLHNFHIFSLTNFIIFSVASIQSKEMRENWYLVVGKSQIHQVASVSDRMLSYESYINFCLFVFFFPHWIHLNWSGSEPSAALTELSIRTIHKHQPTK